MKSATQSLGLLLHDASRALRKRFEQRAADHDLSSAQWRLLLLVCREPGASQGRFADWLDIEPISVSRLIDRMVAGGWLERQDDARDRRVKLVVPTAKALAAQADIKALADQVYGEALAGLTEEEARTLTKGLRTIIANLAGPCPGGGGGASPGTAEAATTHDPSPA